MEINNNLLVVKYGSSCVATPDGLDYERIDQHVDRLMVAREKYDLAVVSSGSVAVGATMWREQRGDVPLPPLHSLATLGSAQAVKAWQDAFIKRGVLAGQVQVTHAGTEGGELLSTLQDNLRHGIVSIVNENDALSSEELKEISHNGDNDGLASLVAQRLAAEHFCLLVGDPEVEGLMNESNELVEIVRPRYFQRALDAAGEGKGEFGSGGIRTKVIAAFGAAATGIRAHIANADCAVEDILTRQQGTYFPPHVERNIVE